MAGAVDAPRPDLKKTSHGQVTIIGSRRQVRKFLYGFRFRASQRVRIDVSIGLRIDDLPSKGT